MTNPARALAVALLAAASLSSCSDKGGDPSRQYGPNPWLPEPSQYLIPPMSVPQAVGWKTGETPSVPAGLRIQAMATGLMHPRIVYPLPNGDILVVESNSPGTKPFRPKDYVQGKVKARAGAGAKGGNRITLLRDANGDGIPELKTVLVDHLHSPYGVAWVAGTLYVANTDAILAFPFTPGQTRITAPRSEARRLPAGPINHHWTKSMVASPDGSKLYVGVGSNSNITENGMDAEEGRAAIYEVDRLTGAKRIYATRNAQPDQSRNPARDRAAVRGGQRARRDRTRPRPGLSHIDPATAASTAGRGAIGEAMSTCASIRKIRHMVAKAIKPDYGLSSHVAALGARVQPGRDPVAAVCHWRVRRRARQLGSKSPQRLPGDLRAVRQRPAERARPFRS